MRNKTSVFCDWPEYYNASYNIAGYYLTNIDSTPGVITIEKKCNLWKNQKKVAPIWLICMNVTKFQTVSKTLIIQLSPFYVNIYSLTNHRHENEYLQFVVPNNCVESEWFTRFFRIMSLMERMTKNLTLDEKSRGTLVVMYTIRNLKRFYKYLFNLQVFLETLH